MRCLRSQAAAAAPTVEDAAAEVVQEAMQIWALEEDGGYRDDISIIIVLLPCWGA